MLCIERQHPAVVGVGKGTKRLNDFLDCTKVRLGMRTYIDVLNRHCLGVPYDVFVGL
jgi:hypothetical protein